MMSYWHNKDIVGHSPIQFICYLVLRHVPMDQSRRFESSKAGPKRTQVEQQPMPLPALVKLTKSTHLISLLRSRTEPLQSLTHNNDPTTSPLHPSIHLHCTFYRQNALPNPLRRSSRARRLPRRCPGPTRWVSQTLFSSSLWTVAPTLHRPHGLFALPRAVESPTRRPTAGPFDHIDSSTAPRPPQLAPQKRYAIKHYTARRDNAGLDQKLETLASARQPAAYSMQASRDAIKHLPTPSSVKSRRRL